MLESLEFSLAVRKNQHVKESRRVKLLVVIPAYNEEASIVSTVEELKVKAPGTDFMIVNDGSRDRTAAICREKGYPLLDLPTNLGLTGAFQTGIRYACAQGYEAALQLDADGQHDPAAIATMAGMMEDQGLDLVLGSRFMTEKRPRSLRMAGNALIEAAIWITTGKRITDPTSGMRLYSRRVMEKMASGIHLRPEPDTIAYLIRCGAKMEECQVSMRERTAGKSYLSPGRSVRYMAQMGMNIFILQWVIRKEKL